MSLTSLLSAKKALLDLKEKQESKSVKHRPPLQVEEDKNPQKRSFALLLELCKQGLVHKLSEEKILNGFEESEEDSLSSCCDPSPFITSGALPDFPFISQLQADSKQVTASQAISESCLQIFDKLCSEMLVMDAEACTKTTVVLQSEAFVGSAFYGAVVTIEEYSTAPKIFNVSITAAQDAVALLNAHMTVFFELLETRNFSFGIHRIDTHLSTDSHRPEKNGDDEGDGQEKEDS